nr:MAG TPA: hypothetical protein [Caudoviricetes sp.]
MYNSIRMNIRYYTIWNISTLEKTFLINIL